MATLDTPNFGLTRVGQGEDLSKGGYKALDKDRLTLDSILKALAGHKHDGASALQPPYAGPSLATSTSGGNIPAGQTYYYSVGYVDAYGLETAKSAEVSISTTAAIDPPAIVNLSAGSGGSLVGGIYTYAITFTQTTGGETTASSTYTLSIDGTSTGNSVVLDLPSLPTGANGFRIYRAKPGQSQLYYVTDTTSDPYTDTGVAEDQTKSTPSSNTTNGFNKVTVTIPGTSAAPGSIPPGVASWRIYRTDTPGTYTGSNLVHEVTEPTTQGGTDLRVTWDDTSVGMLSGAPQQNNSTIATPPKLLWSAFSPEEATTNLITNPSFETGTTSWSLNDGNSSVTMSRAQLNAEGGSWSLKLINSGAVQDDYVSYSLPVAASTVYTISAYSFVDPTTTLTTPATGSRGLYITDGTNISSDLFDTSTTYLGWYRHIVSITTASGATTLTIRLYSPQGTVYYDSCQAEQKGYATAYCDGSLGFDYSWSGTPHASTSSRKYGPTVISRMSILNDLSIGDSILVPNNYIATGATPASSGTIRLSSTQSIVWSNNAGTSTAGTIANNSSDLLSINSTLKLDSSGRAAITPAASPISTVNLLLQPLTTGTNALVMKATPGQASNISEVQDNASNPIMAFDNSGKLKFASSALSTTSASSGAATALPALPTGYFSVVDSGGTTRKIPYYS